MFTISESAFQALGGSACVQCVVVPPVDFSTSLKIQARTSSPEIPFKPRVVMLHQVGEEVLTKDEFLKRAGTQRALMGQWHLEYVLNRGFHSNFPILALGDLWTDESNNLYCPCIEPGGDTVTPRLIDRKFSQTDLTQALKGSAAYWKSKVKSHELTASEFKRNYAMMKAHIRSPALLFSHLKVIAVAE